MISSLVIPDWSIINGHNASFTSGISSAIADKTLFTNSNSYHSRHLSSTPVDSGAGGPKLHPRVAVS
jgi:hypothetical protein